MRLIKLHQFLFDDERVAQREAKKSSAREINDKQWSEWLSSAPKDLQIHWVVNPRH